MVRPHFARSVEVVEMAESTELRDLVRGRLLLKLGKGVIDELDVAGVLDQVTVAVRSGGRVRHRAVDLGLDAEEGVAGHGGRPEGRQGRPREGGRGSAKGGG
eukprot:322186_1